MSFGPLCFGFGGGHPMVSGRLLGFGEIKFAFQKTLVDLAFKIYKALVARQA